MASMLTGALQARKKKAQEEAVRMAAERRAMAAAKNKSGGGIGGLIGQGLGAAGAAATGNFAAIPAAMAVGKQVGTFAGKALDGDEQVSGDDVLQTAATLKAGSEDRDAMKALQDLLGIKK